MENIRTSKNTVSIIIFMLLGILFCEFLYIGIDYFTNAWYWIFSFFMTLIVYYLIYVMITFIQITIIRLFKVFPIKVCSIYPFTYDGKLRFHPLRLLYNIESYHNSLILNLSEYIQHPQLMEKLHSLLWIRKISTIIVISVLFMAFHHYDLITFFAFLLIVLGILSLSYLQCDTFWYGYDFIYSKGIQYFRFYLFGSKTILFMHAEDYGKYMMTIESDDKKMMLNILENYLYRCILEQHTTLTVSQIMTYIEYCRNNNQLMEYNISFDTKMLNIKKLIGWTGIKCHEKKYLECSIDLLLELYDYMVNNSLPAFIKYGTNKLRSEIEYLKNYTVKKDCVLELQDSQQIFSCYESLLTLS